MAPPLSAGLMIISVFFFRVPIAFLSSLEVLNLGLLFIFSLDCMSFNTLVLYLMMLGSISESSGFHPFEGFNILCGLSSSELSSVVSMSSSFLCNLWYNLNFLSNSKKSCTTLASCSLDGVGIKFSPFSNIDISY